MIGFWPVIWPSSTAAVSSSFAFWLASPRPMLTVTFFQLGHRHHFFSQSASSAPALFHCDIFLAIDSSLPSR